VIALEPDAPITLPALRSKRAEPGVATLLIGPEGGWTRDELDTMARGGVRQARLTRNTILRIETAAIAAAAVWMCGHDDSQS